MNMLQVLKQLDMESKFLTSVSPPIPCFKPEVGNFCSMEIKFSIMFKTLSTYNDKYASPKLETSAP